MAAAMHIIGFINSSPRLPSLREEITRWREKRIQKRLHDVLKTEQASKARHWPTTSHMAAVASEIQDGDRLLNDISSEWHGRLDDTASPIVAEFKFYRGLETEIPALVANIQPGSHLSNRETQATRPPLPFPVFIPQRSSRAKRLGFVEAYAPILEQHGVGRNAFSRFMQGLERVMRAAPRLEAVSSLGKPIPFREVSQEEGHPLLPNRYLEEVNRQWLATKALRAYFMCLRPQEEHNAGEISAVHASPSYQTIELDFISDSTSSQTSTTHGEQSMSASQGKNPIRTKGATLMFPGLERAAIQASRGDNLELDALKKVYEAHAALLDQYFERRTRALAPMISNRMSRTLSRPSKAQPGHSSAALSNTCQDREAFRILETDVLYLVIVSDYPVQPALSRTNS